MRIVFKSYNTALTSPSIARYVDDLNLPDWGYAPRWDWKTSTFTTATSGFTYTRLSRRGSYHLWAYEGADKGFMAQDLLPDFGGWEITEVKGSFGLFVGASALLDYREVKEGSGFYAISHTLTDPQAWIARNFRRIKGEPVPVPLHEALAEPVVKQWDRDLYGAR